MININHFDTNYDNKLYSKENCHIKNINKKTRLVSMNFI